MAYDSPNAQVRRWYFVPGVGGTATTEFGRWRPGPRSRIYAVHAVVTTAGTATTHVVDLYSGTTSVASVALGTSTAGASAENTALDLTVEALGQISVKTGPDAAGVVDIIYEYDHYHDAVLAP